MINKFKNEKIKFLIDIFFVTLSCMIMSFSYAAFCIPNNLAPGGFSGLATVLYAFFGTPVGAVSFIMCVPFFVILYKEMGLGAFLKTAYGTFIFSLFIDLMTGKFNFTNDLFLSSVFGGIMFGVGTGLLFKFDGTTGGTELLAVILNKKMPHITISNFILILDGIVVLIAGIAFKNFEIMLYCIIFIFVCTKVIDIIQEGMGYSKAFYIFTDKPEEMKDAIFNNLERGITFLQGRGGYSGNEKEVIFCVVSRMEITALKNIAVSIDNNSFMILADVSEVFGEGFKEHKRQ